MGWVLFAFLLGWLTGIIMTIHRLQNEIRIGMALCKEFMKIKIHKGERLELFINEKDTLYARTTKEDCPK